jgi:hypothetical protein
MSDDGILLVPGLSAPKIGWERGPKWARSGGARICPPRRGGPTSPSQALCFHVRDCDPDSDPDSDNR